MSTYDHHGYADGPGGHYDDDDVDDDRAGIDNGALLRLAEQLVERVRFENPALIGYAEVIRDELTQAAPDGRGANQGRLRSSLDTIAVGVTAGTGSLALTQQLTHALRL